MNRRFFGIILSGIMAISMVGCSSESAIENEVKEGLKKRYEVGQLDHDYDLKGEQLEEEKKDIEEFIKTQKEKEVKGLINDTLIDEVEVKNDFLVLTKYIDFEKEGIDSKESLEDYIDNYYIDTCLLSINGGVVFLLSDNYVTVLINENTNDIVCVTTKYKLDEGHLVDTKYNRQEILYQNAEF